VQGVGYRLAPLGGHVWFDGDAGLSDGYFYGGGLGVSFGEFVELGGQYLRSLDLQSDYGRFSGLEEVPELGEALQDLPQRDVFVERYGGELQLRLSSTGLAPFLTGGAGVVRFDPEGRAASENIYLSAGGGIQLTGADRFAVTVQGGLLSYRYNPGTTFFNAEDLAAVGLTPGQFNNVLVSNLSAQASLRLYLGGRRPGELSAIDRAYLDQFGGGLGGLSLQVEPYYARLSFDDAMPYRDQSFAGVEAGPDFGPLVGLRGFYARGVGSDDPFDFQPIQMYGGLLRLRLAEGTGLVPFLSVGAGYLDVLSGYEADPGSLLPAPPPEDRPFVVGGAGLEIPLSARLRLRGEARAFVLSEQDPSDLSSPEQVYVNPSFRLGVTFGLGGQAGRAPAVVTEAELDRQIREERARREAGFAERDEEVAARERRIAELEREIELARLRGDAPAAARLEAEREVTARVREETRPRSYASDRTVTIPVPAEGEIYIRYGEPGGVQVEDAPRAAVGLTPSAQATPAAGLSDDELRALVREAIRETGEAQAAPATAQQQRVEEALEALLRREIEREGAQLSQQEVQLLERRLLDRFYNELGGIRQELRSGRGDQPIIIQQPPTVITAPGASDPVVVGAEQRRYGSGFAGVMPLAGVALGDPSQLLIGVRVDYQTGFSPTSPRYYPELLLGLGGRRSVTLNFNGVIPFGDVGGGFFPYVGAGGGLSTFAGREEVERDPIFGDVTREAESRSFRIGFNLLGGAEYAVGGGRVFAEMGTVNLTRSARLMGGYRFGF
jgi:hypothetical protein